jgi:ABC-type sulfate/molybdate transport systems ATPase subunit
LLDCRFRKRLPEFDLDVDLTVGFETLALVGRSGAGKSTTLNVIAGLQPPDAGAVTLAGRRLVDVGERLSVPPEGRRIGYVFQDYALFPHLDVAHNVGFGLHGVDRAARDSRVRVALEFVGLSGLEAARPTEISGGERQRVALARALVTRPDALLLDEPLGALDVENRSRIRLELRALIARLAIPTIVVSHDFDDARVLGDRIAAMHLGRVVQIGTSAELASHPVDGFVAALTGTNLVVVGDGLHARAVAFDPWSANLSVGEVDAQYRWKGEIVDMRPLGAHLRVALRAAADLKIDVDVDCASAATAGYRVGDVVVAWVPDTAIRESPSPGEGVKG